MGINSITEDSMSEEEREEEQLEGQETPIASEAPSEEEAVHKYAPGDVSKDGKMRRTRRTKACFNCGKPVDPRDVECPHCKATGESSKVNTGAYLRIALGFFIGLVLWAIFWK